MKFWFLAIFSVWGINAVVTGLPKGLLNSILALPLIWGLRCLYRSVYRKKPERRTVLLALPFALIFSFALVYGAALCRDSNSLVWIGTIIGTLSLLPFILCILICLSELDINVWDGRIKIKLDNPRTGLIIFVIIYGFWIIGLLSMMPGYWGYDGVYQFDSFIKGSVSSHHPVLHTYFMSSLLVFGKEHLGSYESGLLIYSLLQMAILDFAIVRMILFVLKYSKAASLGILACCCLLPFHGILSFSSTKDTLFSAFFILWVLELINGAVSREKWNWKYAGRVTVLSLLMCAFRNNGIYVYIATLPFWAAICRKQWKWVTIAAVITLGGWIGYTGPVYDSLHITKGAVHEMLSVPCQQLSSAYLNSRNLTAEERQKIEEYIPAAENYNARTADNVKNTFNDSLFLNDKSQFMRLWFRTGRKNFRIYLNALANVSIGFWYSDMIYPDPPAWHPYIEYILESNDDRFNEDKWIQIEQWSYFPWVTQINHRFCRYADFQKLPVISMLCSGGFYFWLLMAETFLILVRKKYPYLLGIIPAVMYWGTCILGPVVLLRYAYAYILAAMLMAAPAFKKETE